MINNYKKHVWVLQFKAAWFAKRNGIPLSPAVLGIIQCKLSKVWSEKKHMNKKYSYIDSKYLSNDSIFELTDELDDIVQMELECLNEKKKKKQIVYDMADNFYHCLRYLLLEVKVQN